MCTMLSLMFSSSDTDDPVSSLACQNETPFCALCLLVPFNFST